VPVRLRETDVAYTLTSKKGQTALVRTEYNIEVKVAQAQRMMTTIGTGVVIEKQRHVIPFGNLTWEVDVFGGQNAGLIVAYAELLNMV
jgi:adenylate cyclase